MKDTVALLVVVCCCLSVVQVSQGVSLSSTQNVGGESREMEAQIMSLVRIEPAPITASSLLNESRDFLEDFLDLLGKLGVLKRLIAAERKIEQLKNQNEGNEKRKKKFSCFSFSLLSFFCVL